MRLFKHVGPKIEAAWVPSCPVRRQLDVARRRVRVGPKIEVAWVPSCPVRRQLDVARRRVRVGPKIEVAWVPSCPGRRRLAVAPAAAALISDLRTHNGASRFALIPRERRRCSPQHGKVSVRMPVPAHVLCSSKTSVRCQVFARPPVTVYLGLAVLMHCAVLLRCIRCAQIALHSRQHASDAVRPPYSRRRCQS